MRQYKILNNPQMRVNLTPQNLLLIQREQMRRQASTNTKLGASTLINECIRKQLTPTSI